MADSMPQTTWYLSQNATTGPGAEREAKEYLGEDASLETVPYFPLPPHGEYFEDTEGRFPLEKLVEFLRNNDDTGSTYWYARVLPEKGGPGQVEYLVLHTVGDLMLSRALPTAAHRFIATLKVSTEQG